MGIDADVCRAVAAAVFGDATKVKFSQLNAKERFTALQSGEVDVLSRNIVDQERLQSGYLPHVHTYSQSSFRSKCLM